MAVGLFWAAKLWGATLEKGKAQNQARQSRENTEGELVWPRWDPPQGVLLALSTVPTGTCGR